MDKNETGQLPASGDEVQRLIERVGKLEKQNRMWKLGSILAALVLALSVAMATRAQQQHEDTLRAKTVEAEVFLLKDGAGNVEKRPHVVEVPG